MRKSLISTLLVIISIQHIYGYNTQEKDISRTIEIDQTNIEHYLSGNYIGENIRYLNEYFVFEELSKGMDIGDDFRNKLLSGLLHSNKNIDLDFEHTTNGYKIHMKSGSNDSVFSWGIDDILKSDIQKLFQPGLKDVFTLNFSEHAYWLKVIIDNKTGIDLDIYLEQDKHFSSTFDLYYPGETGYLVKRFDFDSKMGEREISYRNLVLNLSIKPGINPIYIRTDGNLIEPIPLRLWEKNSFIQHIALTNAIEGIIAGVYLLLIVFSFFIFISVKNITYLYFSVTIILNFLVNLSITGFGFQNFWSFEPAISVLIFFCCYPLLSIFNLLFCRSFLEIAEYTPKIDLIINFLISFFLISFLLILLCPDSLKKYIIAIVLFCDYLYFIPVLVSAILIFRKSGYSSLFIMIGSGLYMLAQMKFLLGYTGFIPYELNNYINIKSFMFTAVMTLGLTSKFNFMKKSILKFKLLKEELGEENQKLKSGKKNISEQTKSKIGTVRKFIEENYTESITRESLSFAVGLSPDHLGRAFKQHSGEKISEYLNRIRINQACKLLTDTDKQIIDIAFEVGFESLRTFNKVFSSLKNEPPTQYRLL